MDKNPEATVEQARDQVAQLVEQRELNAFCAHHNFAHSTIYRFGRGKLVELRYTTMCALMRALRAAGRGKPNPPA